MAITAAIILVLLLGALVFSKQPPDALFLCALTLCLVVPVPGPEGWKLGLLSPAEAFVGFANEGMLAVAFLYVVATGVRETGAVDRVLDFFLGSARSTGSALARLLPAAGLMSSFLNNTPVVAILVAPVSDWAKRLGRSPSKLLLPLSYATILGGMLTLLGSSTNLIVAGLAKQNLNLELSLFAVGKLGIPCAVLGLVYLMLAAPELIVDRVPAREELANPREYTSELLVPGGSPLAGKTVEEAGLRNLPGAYLTDVIRENGSSYGATPETELREGDRLVFAGVVESILGLHRHHGLEPATNQVFKLSSARYNRRLFEAVISFNCPIVRQTIREGRFRNRYGAVVLALARNGQRVEGRLGDIELREGDTLLLEARPSFALEYRDSRDFLLLNPLQDSQPRRGEKSGVSLFLLALLVGLGAFQILPLVAAALLVAILMIFTDCCSVAQARRAIDWSVLAIIASAIGLAQAIEVSGLSENLATGLALFGPERPWLAVTGLYLGTWALTEFLTNNAAAVLAFPVALSLAETLGLDPAGLLVMVMIAASSSFLSPFGYQTNLMVYGPGGYRIRDYVKLGLPLGLLVACTAIGLTVL